MQTHRSLIQLERGDHFLGDKEAVLHGQTAVVLTVKAAFVDFHLNFR